MCTLQAMQLRPYSCNFDESTVNGKSLVALNVAYLTAELLVERRSLAVIELEEGSTGQEMADLVVAELQTNNIPIQQMMSVKTDGCSAMLGALRGAQKLLRDKVATLPTFGGCIDHDLANLLKSAVKILNKDLVSIYPAMHACIAKHSMHKKREFEALEREIGVEIRGTPKFLSVRFRVIQILAEWCESQDRALYTYFCGLRDKGLAGTYQPSETEIIVLTKYLRGYLEVRLSQCFLLEAVKPIMKLINYYEAGEVRIYTMHSEVLDLLKVLLARFVHIMANVIFMLTIMLRFVKSSVMGTALANNNLSNVEVGRRLLQIKFTEKVNQVADKELWLGGKVEGLLAELGLTRNSEEIQLWLESNVRGFYEETIAKMKKYFEVILDSATMEALSSLDPKSWTLANLGIMKKKWTVLGEKWSNILTSSEVFDLMDELTILVYRDEVASYKDLELDEVFSKLAQVEDMGSPTFPLVSRLGSSLCTLYNSSSPAERDFSLMKTFVGDPNKSTTETQMLNAKMHIKGELMSLSRNCSKCVEAKRSFERGERKTKEPNHCHCHLLYPSEGLLETLRGGGAHQRYVKDLKEREKVAKADEEDHKKRKERDMEKKKEDLTKEVKELQERSRKAKEAKEKEKAKEAKEKKEEEARKAKGGEKEKKTKKRKRKSAKEKGEELRKRLCPM